MKLLDFIKNNNVLLDGGMGTLLQAQGLTSDEKPEEWNIKNPDAVLTIHKAYLDAGSNIISTNTFGANILNYPEDKLEEIICEGIEIAKKAKELSTSTQEKFIALDIGPCGKLLKPYGSLDFEEAVEVFSKTVKCAVKYGVDLVFLETFSDSYETKAAVLAVKENCDLPVFVSNAYGEDGKLLTGASPEVMVAMLEGLGACAIGANCSLGPDKLCDVVKKLLNCASVPVILKPNANLPSVIDGKTVYDLSPKDFSEKMQKYIHDGVRIFGGCCGTTPEFISELSEISKNIKPKIIEEKNSTVVTSYATAVSFSNSPLLIGERINPTGKKRFKQALLENDISYILNEGILQTEKGVHILDVNVGIPEIDEEKMLVSAVTSLQTVTDLPLQIDTSSPQAMESALRRYNGKAMINSVNGKSESIKQIFPLVKKYGGVVVALTLDENGIPNNPDDRVKIAKKILNEAEKYGIKKKDIIFDTLTLTASADINAPNITLSALKDIKNNLSCHTILGVSNVSFGLPERNSINSTFFALAMQSGLSCAIMNPYSTDMMKAYYSYLALRGLDNNCEKYISFMSDNQTEKNNDKKTESEVIDLKKAITNGMKEKAAKITQEMLLSSNPLDVVNCEIIPALDFVGKAYEEKKAYLPQLLMSAESAKASFEVIKNYILKNETENTNKKCDFIIATVKGDIHDIGKNIVKLLLENYGFVVHDLGKDVSPNVILDAVLKTKASLLGLSALMTTTVPSMEETIKLVKENAPFCKIVVGGAVLTQEYADKIGADKYAKDAMQTVRYAEKIYSNK